MSRDPEPAALDIAAMDRILADIDAKMDACPEGARCCRVRNEQEDDR